MRKAARGVARTIRISGIEFSTKIVNGLKLLTLSIKSSRVKIGANYDYVCF